MNGAPVTLLPEGVLSVEAPEGSTSNRDLWFAFADGACPAWCEQHHKTEPFLDDLSHWDESEHLTLAQHERAEGNYQQLCVLVNQHCAAPEPTVKLWLVESDFQITMTLAEARVFSRTLAKTVQGLTRP